MDLNQGTLARLLPTGEQHEISGNTRFGFARVTITEVAASLRAFTVDGVDIVQRYREDAAPSLGAGIVMAPWPNRIDRGRWILDGETQQLDITEPKFDNAIHGLLSHTAYTVEQRTESSITLSATIFSAPGYPFVVATAVTYSLGPGGLTVQHSLANRGHGTAPVAVGTHGYFIVGDAPTEDLVLSSSATLVYRNDARLLPMERESVAGHFDLRDGRRVGDVELDDCLTGQTLTDGEYRTRLTAPDDRYVEVWTDENFGHIVLLTTRHFVDDAGQEVLAVAIEPQTAAADSLNNGFGLHWLKPGEGWTVTWGVRAQL